MINCTIYCVNLPVSGIAWRVQDGYSIVGTYRSLKGAKIAASKRGYSYKVTSGYGC